MSSSEEDLDYAPGQLSGASEALSEVDSTTKESQFESESDAEFTDTENDVKKNTKTKTKSKSLKKRSKVSPPKKIKEKRSRFLDTEAEVGDETDEEEDIEGDEFLEEFIANSDEEEEAVAVAAELDQFRQRRAISTETEDFDAEAEEQRLKALYGRQNQNRFSSETARTFASSPSSSAMIPRPFLLPTVTDPKLWLCRAQQGRERSASLALLRVVMERQYSGQPLQIFSIISRDGLKGYVYIEAHKPIHVAQAIEVAKLNHCLYPGQAGKSLVLVPLAEMPQVLQTTAATGTSTSSAASTEIPEIGAWIRVKRGRYANDLAQVVDNSQDEGSFDPSNLNTCIIRVKLLPRLNFNNTGVNDRIPPRLFDPEEASRNGPVSKSRGFWIYGGETYRDGFLFKNIRLSSLNCTGVTPTLEELARFPEVEGLEESAAGLSLTSALNEISLAPGDQVLIVEGEMKNLEAKVDSLEFFPNTTTGRLEQFAHLIADESSGLTGESARLLLKVVHLRKIFAVGEQVRLLSGPHIDEIGIVVAIEANTKNLVIFASESNKQFSAPASICALAQASGNDLNRHPEAIKRSETRSSTHSTPQTRSNEFSLDDLVQFEVEIGGEEGVGVVVKILDSENSVAVFDSLGQVRTIPCRSIKLLANFFENSERHGHASLSSSEAQFKQGDRVTEQQQGHNATTTSSFYKVLHIYKSLAFLRPLSGVIPSGSAAISILPLENISKPSRPAPPTFRSNAPTNAPPVGHLLGKSVSITGGPQKGYVGFVKQVADNIARVELHTNGKIISVAVDKLALVGGTQNNRDAPRAGMIGNRGGFADTRERDRDINSRTPAWNSTGSLAKTPAWNSAGGSKTPGWNSSSSSARTPGWNSSSSSRTPGWNPSASSSSSRTPAWNSSASRTPAWNSSSATTATPGHSSSSAKTPAWSTTTGMTPAWNVPTALGPSNTAANWQKGATPAWNSAASRTPAWSRGPDRDEVEAIDKERKNELEKKPWDQVDNWKKD